MHRLGTGVAPPGAATTTVSAVIIELGLGASTAQRDGRAEAGAERGVPEYYGRKTSDSVSLA